MNSELKCLLIIGMSVIFTGCAVPYAKKGTGIFMGGYEDKELEPGIFYISIKGNSFTSYKLAETYFHRRAAELCSGRGYTHNLMHTSVTESQFGNYGYAMGTTNTSFPVVEGRVECNHD